jgi:hypothetical protein
MIAEPALKLYGRFSPGVARDMNSSPALRQAMRLYAVVPVFHLVNAAETYLAADSDSPEVVKKLGRLFNEYLDDVKRARSSASELSQAAEGALVASRMLTGAFPERGLASDTMPRSLFPSLATAIRSTGGSTTAFAWALTGIGLFLTEAAATLEGRANTAAFLRLLGAWVARMPIPPEDQLRISDVRRELGVLADRIFRRPDLRGLFAQHLVAHWPATSAPTLAALLRDAGFGDASGEH